MQIKLDKAVNYYNSGKIIEAKKICLEIHKKNSKAFHNLRLLNLIYFKEKNFSEALNFINKAIEINQNFPETYNEKGNALIELKRFNEAIESYDKAIKISNNYSDAYYNKGLALQELKKIDLLSLLICYPLF